MYLKSVSGKILYRGNFSSVLKMLEHAVEDNIDLTGVNLRGTNLAGAQLDGAIMPQACFWGANLNSINMSDGDFNNADFRTANFLNSCLVGSNFSSANLEGAYFSRTIVTHTDFSHAQFSCPSVFSLDLTHTRSMVGACYSHQGEVDCDLSHPPLVIYGLPKPLIFMDDCVLIGTDLKKTPLRSRLLQNILYEVAQHGILADQKLRA